MDPKRFFRVFARLVEKVTREPVDSEVDFDWESYFDSDMPPPSQVHCARLAADEYLRENGWRHDLDVNEVLQSVLVDLVS